MNNERRKLNWTCSSWTFCLCQLVLSAKIKLHNNQNRTTRSLLRYLDVSPICGAEVPYCAAVDRNHGDRGDQGVRQLLLPVLQPLDKLGDLQAILAFFPFVDSLVWITIIRGALENEKDGVNKAESLQRVLVIVFTSMMVRSPGAFKAQCECEYTDYVLVIIFSSKDLFPLVHIILHSRAQRRRVGGVNLLSPP